MMTYSRMYDSPYSSLRSMPKQPIVYPEDIQCVSDPDHNNVGGIYISNLEAAQNPKTLSRYNIKAVITAANGATLNHSRTDIPHYKYIPGEDHENYDLSRYFDEAVKFIDEHLSKTNVLVHCMAGISRSVTLVLAYLIKVKKMDYHAAFAAVKSRRKIISPNGGFIQQLQRYEREVKRRISQSPEKRYQQPEKRYQTPQQSRRVASSYSTYENTMTSSTIIPRQTAKDYNYQNEEELDQKIAQIRKKYSELSSSQGLSRSFVGSKTDTINYPYRYRDRYARPAIDLPDRTRFSQYESYRSPIGQMRTTERISDRFGYESLLDSRRRPQSGGLPLRKIFSLGDNQRF